MASPRVLNVVRNYIGDEEHGQEGRAITAEYDLFIHTPNSQRIGLFEYCMTWGRCIPQLIELKRKPVIL